MNLLKKLKQIDYPNFLRLALILFTFYFLELSAYPIKTFALFLNGKIHESPRGIGGMSYTESELKKINVRTGASETDIAIPEPLEFSAPRPLLYSDYTIQTGDMIGFIAESFGLSQGTLISVNGIKNTRSIYPREVLRIPNQDGILHTVAEGDTLESIAAKYEVDAQSLITVNELFSGALNTGSVLFVSGAKLDSTVLQEINGDLFIWPVRSYISSRYGYRVSPITGARTFHAGIDIGAPLGTPIKAAMSGLVTSAGYNDIYGNFVVISHHSGYRTLYGHMNEIKTKSGAYVKTGQVIGYVGNTGQSTGSHLHFTVYKNRGSVNPLLLMN